MGRQRPAGPLPAQEDNAPEESGEERGGGLTDGWGMESCSLMSLPFMVVFVVSAPIGFCPVSIRRPTVALLLCPDRRRFKKVRGRKERSRRRTLEDAALPGVSGAGGGGRGHFLLPWPSPGMAVGNRRLMTYGGEGKRPRDEQQQTDDTKMEWIGKLGMGMLEWKLAASSAYIYYWWPADAGLSVASLRKVRSELRVLDFVHSNFEFGRAEEWMEWMRRRYGQLGRRSWVDLGEGTPISRLPGGLLGQWSLTMK